MKLVFWLCTILLAYHIVFYGVFLSLFNKIFRKKRVFPKVADEQLPSIEIVCAAYNEENIIEEKIKSFLLLDYPKDKIRMLVISDDSTDRTNEIVQRYASENVELIIQKPRAGKQSAQNMVVPLLKADYILSTDANTILRPDSVRIMAEVMLSDSRIGLASGTLILDDMNGDSGEGLFWKYETWLKQQDSDFYSIIVSNGSLFMIRRDLFKIVDNSSADDFERALVTLHSSYIAVNVPEALASEPVTGIVPEEIGRKIRIITQEWNTIARNYELLNFFKYPQVSFLLISHKILRWLFFVFVIGIFVSSLLLANILFYRVLFYIQVICYLVGGIELYLQSRKKHIPGAGFPAYSIGMFYASIIAFKNFIVRKNFGIWNPTR
ncbi:MAG TPA: glycosyltransferase [Candidatus Cloacimonadota bacterium]|nr:glycosyltransferase [Candidatus Cloacimonadota bacterium]HPT71332.1 glycosyltransferase [Candidatus Cloacimonadota bacterium]